MSRYPKDIVELVAERTHRHILRILFHKEGLNSAEIGRELTKLTSIKFKSTSSITEALQRLMKNGLIDKRETGYYLTRKSKERWIISFLNSLVKEKVDKGALILSNLKKV